ncbi:TetR/AcrR family transcriptional regulator [Nocardia huaxiensis]|uniref:TetR/AcrR family transcriptional regulator n=1 Tax=Nocardia huaxiensis TaxID=2755382 RepID=A0A7D6VBM2_9NOCA|nr:TetR/AcrR family transcriptional regulator [Nocardia huaxiensis]QLY28375.1 TetR/AcrR family transcriptional regulator [Nocardia huaxiensis]UFS98173.1 TetR/AcrR family transcriptional regulator [Nocardia huaxiensis]
MGTREDLLAGAKQCLAERGLARTTVRDIVAASGTNLAAINYHFGSRDQLLNQAMLESSGEAVSRILESLPEDTGLDAAERLNTFWHKLLDSFAQDRALWTANAESISQALHSPELGTEIGAAQQRAREGLSESLGHNDPRIGAVLQTLIGGLLIQALIDPARTPSPDQLSGGLRALADLIGTHQA